IKPHGYAVWEAIQRALDAKIKETGHQNAYFPLFIPKSFLAREAKHVEGFALECAVVTHAGLKRSDDPKKILEVTSPLEEELVIRPTSETIINDAFSRWVQSWRDLPVLVNQWANVVRWEMRTRLFLRTTEFLWQEGHTAHETAEEAEAEARKMLDVYRDLAENHLALSAVAGEKSAKERFAGADRTYTIEAMMQDRKALQAGTSHNLGQNFAKAFNIQFQDREGTLRHVWQTSWGVSTRLVGAVVMAHSDDRGLVLPPRLAPIHVAIVPIYKSDEERARVVETARKIAASLAGLAVKVDDREHLKPGAKYYEWEKKGVPVRVEIGPRDLAKNEVVVVRRDKAGKTPLSMEGLPDRLRALLDQIQSDLLAAQRAFREANTHAAGDPAAVKALFDGAGGFADGLWCGSGECEAKLNADTGATIRCMPFGAEPRKGSCALCGKPAQTPAIFARAY
ncbi:MAG: proline--tRNA ligase, partial [Planctomycetes bacterium]|nr:proline--tRNA ligase [Planctomycetota bacterium]